MFATVANAVMWLWTTVGVAVELLFQVIPASLGLVQTIDAGLARTLFSWTLHAIVYFWLIPAYIAFYTMVPRAAGGRLYSDTMGRLTFILFLVYSLPVGMHHLMMDPEHGNGWKFIQMLLTAFVSVPTLLTIFTITASLEIAGRLRGGRGVFGWIAKLAVGAAAGARDRACFRHARLWRLRRADQHGLWHERHGAQHLVGHGAFSSDLRRLRRHHVFRDRLRDLAAPDRPRARFARAAALQLWLWFVGMMVMTLPWHWLGLQGQWRRVANFNYADPIIAAWGPWVIVSLFGGSCCSRPRCCSCAISLSFTAARCRSLNGRSMRWRCIRRIAFRPRSTALDSGTCWCLF